MPTLAMLLAVILWSSVVVAGKAAVETMPFAEIAAVRFVLAAALLWSFVWATGQAVRPPARGLRPLLMGLLDPGLASLLVFWGLSLTSAVNVATFWSLMPLVMPLLGRLVLAERIGFVVLAGALIALSGAALLSASQSGFGQGSFLGDAIAAAGVLSACASQLLARRVALAHGEPVVATAWQMTAAVLVGALGVLVFPEPGKALVPDLETALIVLFLGTIGTAGPFLLYNYALRRLPVGRISLLLCLSGPLALPMAALFLGERIAPLDLAAVAIVAAGALLPSLTAWIARDRPTPADPALRELELVVIDTETTGLRARRGDELVQLAGVVVRNGRLEEGFQALVDPGRPIPPAATAIHGLTDAMVSGRPPAAEGAARLAEFAAGRPIVAFDAGFDLEFLRRHVAIRQPVLCLLRLARALEEGRDCSLEALARRYAVSLDGRHSAPGDARIAAELLLRLLPAAEARGLGTLRRALAVASPRTHPL